MSKKLLYFISTMFSSSSVKHHGLVNKGATCYLNSILQVLFMTKDFREAVQRPTSDSYPDYIDSHLKELFDDLLKRTGDTSNIIKALQIDTVYEQQDAAQYFERILRLTSPEAAKIFQGQLAHRTICCTCQTKTDVDGPFWHLPLPLVDHPSEEYSVLDGIRKFFQSTDFSGDNQMFCDECDDKVDATSQYVIKHHPDVLILLLKRFSFNYSYMSFIKINCVVDVPYSVTIPENQVYELYAVVNHYGDLRSGHYIAIIKSQDEEERWHTFDDTNVSTNDYVPFQFNETEKSRSAYLLIYRKKDVGTQNLMKIPTNEGSPPATIENCDQNHDVEMSTNRQETDNSSEIEMSVDSDDIKDHLAVTDMQGGPQSHQTCGRASLDLGDSPQEAHVKDLERGRREDENTKEDAKDENPDFLSAPENEAYIESNLKSPSGNYGESPPDHSQVHIQAEVSDPQSSATDVNIDENEEPEKREKLQTEHLSGNAEDQGFSSVSLNIREYQEDKPKEGEHDNLKSAPVGKQVPEMRIKTDVKEETRSMEPNTGDEEHVSKIRAPSPRPQDSEGVVDQDQRDADDDYLNMPKDQICVGHEECKNDGVEGHATSHQNEDECSLKQTQPDQSGKLLNQEAGSDEQMMQVSRLEGPADGGCTSKKSTLTYKIIETEFRKVPTEDEGNEKTQEIISETVVSHGTLKRHKQQHEGAVNRKFDPVNDAVASLPTGVSSMKLDEQLAAEQQKPKFKRAIKKYIIHKKRFSCKKKRKHFSALMGFKRNNKQNRRKLEKSKKKSVNQDSEAD